MVGFGLDVDLIAGQAGGQTGVLALLADGQGQLVVGHDDAAALAVIGHPDIHHVGGGQGGGNVFGGIFAEFDDVDLFAVEGVHHGGDALALGAHAGADGIDALVAGQDGHLGAAAGFAGHVPDLDDAVVDLGHLQLEQALHQARVGAGHHDLGAPGAAADLHHVDLAAHPLGQHFAGDLLADGEQGVGGFRAGADAQADVAVARVDAGDGAGEDLVLLAGELVVDHIALGFFQALDDDLLSVAGGDAAEIHVVHGDADGLAHADGTGDGLGVGAGDLAAGILHLVHHGFLEIHLQCPLFLVHAHDHVFRVRVVVLIGVDQGLGDFFHHIVLRNAFFFFQHIQCCKDLFDFHAFFRLLFLFTHLVLCPLQAASIKDPRAGAPGRPPLFQNAAFRRPRPAAPRRPHNRPDCRRIPCARPCFCTGGR